MDTSLENKVAIVTGASRGIGKAIADVMAAEGAQLVLVARDGDALKDVARGIEERGGRTPLAILGDLKQQAAATRVVEAAIEKFGRLDILVNNAGATARGDFLKLTDEESLDGFALKFHAAVRMCRTSWPHLVASQGSICNIIGVSSRTPTADFTIGGPVNSALLNFTKALAERGISEGVRVNAVNPGHILTDRLLRRVAVVSHERGISMEEAQEAMRVEHGIWRYGKPEEIARVVAFVCSPAGAYINGATLDVDGGATRGI